LSDPDAETARTAKSIRIDDLGAERFFDLAAIYERYGWDDGANKSLLNIPLTDRKG